MCMHMYVCVHVFVGVFPNHPLFNLFVVCRSMNLKFPDEVGMAGQEVTRFYLFLAPPALVLHTLAVTLMFPYALGI